MLKKLKTVEKTAIYDKDFFLSKFCSFLNIKPVRSEIEEESIALSQRDECDVYVILGETNGKIGVIECSLIPSSLLSTAPSTDDPSGDGGEDVRKTKSVEERTLWIVEVRLRRSLTRSFLLAVEHFLSTWYGIKTSKME